MAEERVERRLAAIFAADVVGYSRLMGSDEEGTLAALKRHRRELVAPKIKEHRGRIVKLTGDGILVEFASVVDAVRCAVDIQRGMAERNVEVPAERRIEYRIGLNLGDIIIDGEDIYGDGVNVAARLDLERSTRLEARGVASRQTLDTQRAQMTALEAAVEADQAAIDMAQLQLEFSTIAAPLEGRTGLRLVDPGTVVHAADANGLVTITQMQPIAVLFTVSQDDLPEVLAAMARGDPVVIAYTRDGERPLATGKLVFVDSQVDQATGHVKLKALFDNSDRALWPGEFVDARVQVATVNAATVVPAKAVEHGQNGTYVYRIKPADTVEVVPVTIGRVAEGIAIITDGLAPGDRIVVDGQYRLQPGARVEPRKATAASGS